MDDYGDDFDDEDYIYMEDTYIQADDLAEHAVASPVPFEGDEDFDPEHWRYEYWMDIEYDSDGDAIRARQADSKEARLKRKRREATDDTTSKRRKIQSGLLHASDDSPAVLLVQKRVNETMKSSTTQLNITTLKPWALLKNWRDHLENAPIFTSRNKTVMLAEVADEPEEDVGAEYDDLEDEEVRMEGQENDSDMSQLGAIDPDILKKTLREKMAAAGLTGMDEDMLMSFAARMLANEGEADDIAGELAEELLEQEDDDVEGGTLSEWVSQQVQTSKVDADRPLTPTESASMAVLHEDTPVHRRPPTPASTATSSSVDVNLPAPMAKSARAVSPRGQKRKAELSEEKRTPKKTAHAHTSKVASAAVQSRKRKVDAKEETESREPKRPARATRSFDAPTAASKSRAASTAGIPAKSTRKGKKG